MTNVLRRYATVLAAGFAILWLTDRMASAEIRLPNLLSDHAVLQRESPIHLWGWATPGAKLTIHFHDQRTSTTADEFGQWTTWLSPEHAGGPYVLEIDGGEQEGKRELADLMVGDVWIASGQSNMEFEMRKASTAAADLPKASNPRIRLMMVDKVYTEYPRADLDATSWTASTPESAAQ